MKRCERCGSPDLLVVGFDSLDGARFAYCRACEHRVWRRRGETPLAVTTILAQASSLPEGRRGRRRKIAS